MAPDTIPGPGRHDDAPEPAARDATRGERARLRAAGHAIDDFGRGAAVLLRLRRQEAEEHLRSWFWRLTTSVLMVFLGAIVIASAAVLVLVGAAACIADAVGVDRSFGLVAVGALVLSGASLVVARRGRTRRGGERAIARLAAHRQMSDAGRRLLRATGLGFGLAAAGVLGFSATRLLRHRSARRLALVALRATQALGKVSRPAADTPATPPADAPQESFAV